MKCPNCEHVFENELNVVSVTAVRLFAKVRVTSRSRIKFSSTFEAEVVPNIRNLAKCASHFTVGCPNCKMQVVLNDLVREVRCFTCNVNISPEYTAKFDCQVASDMIYCQTCTPNFIKQCGGCKFLSKCTLGKQLQKEVRNNVHIQPV